MHTGWHILATIFGIVFALTITGIMVGIIKNHYAILEFILSFKGFVSICLVIIVVLLIKISLRK